MAKCCGQESYGNNQRPRNDRRLQLIDEIKQFLQDTENKERSRMSGGAQRATGRSIPGVRDMEEECRQYRKRRECSPPIITSLGAHEIRPTSNYDVMKYSNSKQVTFMDATRSTDPYDPMPPAPWELPRTPSQELRAGNLYTSCECRKRNGLQYDCPRWDCGGRRECVAVNPGPCCVPSKARKPVRGDRRNYKGGSSAEDPGKQQCGDYKVGQSGLSAPEVKAQEAMMCVCAPVGMGQPSRPQQPQKCEPTGECVGFVAVTSPGTHRQAGPGKQQWADKKVGPSGFTGPGARTEEAMMCLCAPADMGQPPRPQPPPQQLQQCRPNREVVGIVAVTGGQGPPAPPSSPKGADVFCFCQPASPQAPPHNSPPPRQQQCQPRPRGEFAMVTPAGKYLCCPL